MYHFPSSRRFRALITAGIVLLSGYVIAVTSFVRIDEFVLITRPGPLEAPRGVARQVVVTTNGQVELFSQPVPKSATPQAYVLRFSGNARAETVIRQIATRWGLNDVETWCMNYPGSGGSTGPGRLKKVGPAALAAFDALSRQAAGKPIFVDGNSFGAAVALHVAANRPVAGVLVQNPPMIRELARSRFRGPVLWLVVWPVSLQVPDELDALANARRCTAPAVFIRSTDDEAVPWRFQQQVIDAYRGPIHRMEMAGDHETLPETAASDLADAVRWLKSQSSTASAIE